jgi:DNA-directed RNA polymerase sigma subunit (sigma70/sigma32)
MLGTLTEMEEAVLKLSFGFCDNKQLSLQEVADCLNLTPERVRQVMAKALRKLRHPARSHVFLKNKSDYFSANFDFYRNIITVAYEGL